MRYHNITTDDMLNGDGLRTVLWVAGCEHHCKGCQNPSTWDLNDGLIFDIQTEIELFERVAEPYISGVTFSGGDPLHPANRSKITELAMLVKQIPAFKTVWIYTGYLWEEVKDLPVMEYTDVLVDGPFIEELADINYHWAGSTNQRVIDVQASLKKGTVVLHGDGTMA